MPRRTAPAARPGEPARALLVVATLTLLLASPGRADENATAPVADPAASAAAQRHRAWAQATLQLINEARAQAGVAPLQAHPNLAVLAQAHSSEMASQGRLSHDGFEQRRRLAGGGRCVENVAQGVLSPAPLLAAWMAQAGHRRNLLAPGLRQAAVASEGRFVTFMACD